MQRNGQVMLIALALLVSSANLVKSDDDTIDLPRLRSALNSTTVNGVAENGTNEETDQIIGGSVVSQGYDFMVQLYDTYWNFICSATLIAPDRVLTAAHCAVTNKNDPQSPLRQKIYAVANSKTLYNPQLNSYLEVTAIWKSASGRNIIIHPWYRQYSGYGDLAVLKLDNPFDSTTVRPTYWNQYSKDYETYSLVAAGWGMTESSYVSAKLKTISLKSVNEGGCQATNYYNLCTNYENGGICFGDSGGALLGTQWSVQIGINSGVDSDSCRGRAFYTRIFAYKEWIANPYP